MYRVETIGEDGSTLGGRERNGQTKFGGQNENPGQRRGSTKKSLVVALSLDG